MTQRNLCRDWETSIINETRMTSRIKEFSGQKMYSPKECIESKAERFIIEKEKYIKDGTNTLKNIKRGEIYKTDIHERSWNIKDWSWIDIGED